MGHFLPFYSLKNQKNQNFEKTKKLAKDIIILPKCTKNYNEVQFLRCRVRQTYFFCHFGPFFARYPPPPPNNLENQNFEKKKRKKHPEMSSFYTVHQKSWSYDVCFLRDGVWQTSCHFGPFFALLPQYRP